MKGERVTDLCLGSDAGPSVVDFGVSTTVRRKNTVQDVPSREDNVPPARNVIEKGKYRSKLYVPDGDDVESLDFLVNVAPRTTIDTLQRPHGCGS